MKESTGLRSPKWTNDDGHTHTHQRKGIHFYTYTV